MVPQLFNWRTVLALAAVAIVTGTIFYSDFLAKKIAKEERQKVNVWVQSLRTSASTTDESALQLTQVIKTENTDIPIIATDENDNPLGMDESLNIDTNLIKSDTGYLRRKVNEFKKQHPPISLELSKDPPLFNRYYYGDTTLLQEVRYYPIVQLIIVALFLFIIIYSIGVKNKSTQNQVWAGMAKETAHQLGTPISSLEGWIEMLKDSTTDTKIASEMEKDINRLKLISDRFGKIGSTPKLEPHNIVEQIRKMVGYIKRRATDKVNFEIDAGGNEDITAMISAPLFDWVIENLLKNALDAMEGKGSVAFKIRDSAAEINIDVTDTGKGISKNNISKVFKPGFTTKKRGWGLGLSLSKRIIEQYHRGHLSVRSSDSRGTTFRITLKK